MTSSPGVFGTDRPVVLSAGDAVAELLRKAIRQGRIEPGQRLKETELAAELGTSRTPVREALRILRSEGLVDFTPNRGATVCAYSADDLEEIYQLRALLEGYAAARAATRISASELRRLEKSVERFARLHTGDDYEELVEEDLRFHGIVWEVSRGDRVRRLARQAAELPVIYGVFRWYVPEQKLASEQAHREILAALRQGDARLAEEQMRLHLLAARDVLLAHLGA